MEEYMNSIIIAMQIYHNNSLNNAKILYRNFLSKIMPKRFYRHIINISDSYIIITLDNKNCVEYNGWDKDFIENNIIGWLNKNTKGSYFIVLFNRFGIKTITHETRDRIYFNKKQDAATFKLYFK